jgi:hypothetical protein
VLGGFGEMAQLEVQKQPLGVVRVTIGVGGRWLIIAQKYEHACKLEIALKFFNG